MIIAPHLSPPIITSLLDTDLYKLTMMQCVLHQFPSALVEYKFSCRNQANIGQYIHEIENEINHLCDLQFTQEELNFLATLDYIKSDFIEFLRIFKLNRDFIKLSLTQDKQLSLVIEGPWLHTILFEVPVLAIINEVYFRNQCKNPDYAQGQELLKNKIGLIKATKDVDIQNFRLADFGTRRRFSKSWHDYVLNTLVNSIPENFIGSSNILLAKKYHLIPVGTMAHEFLQACQAVGPRLIDSQKYAFEVWAQEYRGRLGTALTDVVGLDAFLRDFDLYFSKLFDGLRQDSGDPIIWGERVIEHYKKIKIDPTSKLLTFSDSLTIPLAINIYKHFYGRATTAFGIGTNLTNDLGYEPIQIVIKMVRCNNQPVAKISDSPGKTVCDDKSYVQYLKQVFSINNIR